MKKIFNTVEGVVKEMIQGIVATHSDLVCQIGESYVICQKDTAAGLVGLVSGGGSGHEPAHAGFVGQGMLTAAICGEVFTSPTPDQILQGIQAANQGAGVLLIVKNYSGDIMNFDMAKQLAELEDITVSSIVVDDDIAVKDSTYTQGRRGVAGTVFVHKILGAAAVQGSNLAELEDLGKRVIAATKSIGVALSGATVPALGKPGFTLAANEMEFGVGIHGEPGYQQTQMATSSEIASEMIDKLKQACEWKQGDKVAVLINGLGNTPLMEQYIFAQDVYKQLEAEGLKLVFKEVGNYMTAIDMAGVSLSVLSVVEDQWLEYLNAHAQTIAWKK